jgi:hypothetical protein
MKLVHHPLGPLGGTLRRPEEVAGALAKELVGLYRDVAAVTIARQTLATISPTPSASMAAVRLDGRSGVAPRPRSGERRSRGDSHCPTLKTNPLSRSANGQTE